VDIVRAGAAGVLSKEISAHGLVRALRGVTRGEAPLSREAATLLVEGVQSIGIAADARNRVGALSTRELEVLDLMSRGHSNRAISLELGLSEFTAKRHVQNILCKLDVHSRLEASATYHSFVERSEAEDGRA
jgi:DNA-binding NarL/FixJ family response regulator